MSVDVDICNSAIIKLGCSELISALSDNTKEARLCNHQYPRVLKAVLRSAPWSFALKRALLTPVVVTLEFGDEAVFQLPADCVRVCAVDAGDTPFAIEGRRILSNATDSLELSYVSSNITPASFDFAFQEAVSCALAADLAYPMTQSQALQQGLTQMSEFWINQARSYNSQEKTPEDFRFDKFLDARTGGSDEIY